MSVDTKHQTMGGIAFPMTDDASAAVADLAGRRVDYVQLSVDTKKEIIALEEKGACDVKGLPKKVPENSPRYHLFVFKHTHEGDYLQSVGEFNARITLKLS